MGSINELLAETNRHLVNLPELEPAALKRVLAALREALGTEPEVSHPRLDLEQFFLGVVEKARAETKEQTGVRHADGLADYLSSGQDEGAGSQRLEGLVAPPDREAKAEAPEPEPAGPPKHDGKADEKLKDLLPPSS